MSDQIRGGGGGLNVRFLSPCLCSTIPPQYHLSSSHHNVCRGRRCWGVVDFLFRVIRSRLSPSILPSLLLLCSFSSIQLLLPIPLPPQNERSPPPPPPSRSFFLRLQLPSRLFVIHTPFPFFGSGLSTAHSTQFSPPTLSSFFVVCLIPPLPFCCMRVHLPRRINDEKTREGKLFMKRCR